MKNKDVTRKTTAKQDLCEGQSNALSAEEIYRNVFHNYPDVLDVKQVGEALSVSNKTVYKLLRSGCIKSLRIGNVYRIPKPYIQQYIKIVEACGVNALKGEEI